MPTVTFEEVQKQRTLPVHPPQYGPDGRVLSDEEIIKDQEARQAKADAEKAAEPGIAEKIATAVKETNEDPIGSFARGIGTILKKTGVMDEADADRLTRDIYHGITAMGPLGSEFVPVAGAKATVAAETTAAKQAPKVAEATAAKPQTLSFEEVLQSRIDAVTPTPRAGNINLDRIYAPEDVVQAINDVAKENKGFTEARRGVQTFEEAHEMGKLLGITPSKLQRRAVGTAWNAEHIDAARHVLIRQAHRFRDAAKYAHDNGHWSSKIKAQEEWTRLVAVQEQVAGLTAEAGRALSVFRRVAGSKEDMARLAAMTKEGNIDEIIERVHQMDNAPIESIAQFASEAFKAKTSDKLLEVWINALLSGPTTHATNILSNSLVSLWSIPETALAAGISKLTGSGIRFNEAAARTFGIIEGTKDGLRAAARAFKTEEPSDLASKIEVRKYQAISGAKGRIVRLPGRFLLAQDEFFKAIGYAQELNARAVRTASAEGLTGKSFADRVAGIKADPSDEIREAARKTAETQTFTNQLGKIGSDVLAWTRQHPSMRIIAPFIRTPANIVKFAAKRSPAALLFKDVRATLKGAEGAAARDEAIARIGFGSMVGAATVYGAMQGMVTGGGPSDPRERAVLYANGWQPYSFKIGDTYYSYGRLEPLGMLLGISSDFAELQARMTEDEKASIASLITGSISRNLVSKTWLRGISDAIEAFNDPERNGQRWLMNMVGTVVPTGVAQTSRVLDPYLREARTTLDKIKERIPGLREKLPVKRDLFGEPIQLGGALGPDILSPVYQSKAKNDPVVKELVRLDFAPSRLMRQIRGVDLSTEQYDVLQQETGKFARLALDKLVGTTAWKELPDEEKRDKIVDAFRWARDKGRAVIVTRYPDLAEAIAIKKGAPPTGE